ncbi:hypothetical protein CNR22_03760 [Sphingobacteriaceae bacterium]|nr:hypothetical protein CNR22_03760 [Sphingobacteriaceae bacterium]
MKQSEKIDKLPIIWLMLSNMFPPIGFVLYFKHKDQSPKKAKKSLIGALIGIPMGIMMSYIFNNYIFV